MAEQNMREVFGMLFTEPVYSIVEAEKRYRTIWLDWIDRIVAQLPNVKKESKLDFLTKQIDMAPIMNFSANVEVGVSMKLSSMEGKNGEVKLGVSVAPVELSGTFGFVKQETRENSLTAKAQYGITNTNSLKLKDLLEMNNVTLDADNPDKFKAAAVKALSDQPRTPVAG